MVCSFVAYHAALNLHPAYTLRSKLHTCGLLTRTPCLRLPGAADTSRPTWVLRHDHNGDVGFDTRDNPCKVMIFNS